jgi:hypothetical protein
MKYVLILYLCSLSSGQCPEKKITGYTFSSHYDCAIAGYVISGQTYKNLVDDQYYGLERLNREKIAIKFECKEMPSA